MTCDFGGDEPGWEAGGEGSWEDGARVGRGDGRVFDGVEGHTRAVNSVA